LSVAVSWSAFVASASAVPLPPPPQQALVLVRAGAVWFDDGVIVLQGSRPGHRRLGTIRRPTRLPQMASSASAAAGLLSEQFVGGVPPGPLRPIAQPKPVNGGACKRWEPATRTPGEFVVAGEDLVATAECPAQPGVVQLAPGRQPVFVRSVRRGRWRVLRWVTGYVTPILAAEGTLVAIGAQLSGARMQVTIIDVRDGATQGRFTMPDGYLAFASPDRLVLSAKENNGSPLQPLLQLRRGTVGGPGSPGGYRLALYSTQGRRIASVGSFDRLPLVSAMHLVTEEYSAAGEQIIALRKLPDGSPRRVIGFNDPGRALLTLAFRWPMLAFDETTSQTLPASRVDCQQGYYGPPSKPFLTLIDVTHERPFLAPPPPSPLLGHDLLKGCPIRL
jgi:hypothetical protein